MFYSSSSLHLSTGSTFIACFPSNKVGKVKPNVKQAKKKGSFAIEEEKDTQDTQTSLQLIPRRAALTIPSSMDRPLFSCKEIFLQNDMFIEFNLFDEDNAFLAFKEVQKNFRPVQQVQTYKQSHFLVIDFDQSQRGLRDYRAVSCILDSMQDAQLHLLASRMLELEKIIAYFADKQDQRRELLEKNAEIFNRFKTEEIPAILSRLNQRELYSFSVFQCVEDMLDSTCVQYGCNENLIRLLGSDAASYAQLIMRQGWFDLMQFRGRNEQSLEFLQTITTLAYTNFDFSKLELGDRVDFITFDGIKGSAKIHPEVFCCFGEDEDVNFPNTKILLGYMYGWKYTLDEFTKKRIIAARAHQTTIVPSELVYEPPAKSMQNFYYNCETQVFNDFNQKHARLGQHSYPFASMSNPSQAEINRTCKFRMIHPQMKE